MRTELGELTAKYKSTCYIKPTGENHTRFGPCEMCGEKCSEVFIASYGPDTFFGCESCCSEWMATMELREP